MLRVYFITAAVLILMLTVFCFPVSHKISFKFSGQLVRNRKLSQDKMKRGRTQEKKEGEGKKVHQCEWREAGKSKSGSR